MKRSGRRTWALLADQKNRSSRWRRLDDAAMAPAPSCTRVYDESLPEHAEADGEDVGVVYNLRSSSRSIIMPFSVDKSVPPTGRQHALRNTSTDNYTPRTRKSECGASPGFVD